MAASNYRNTSPQTVHHLVSRIAHSVFLMEDDQRSDFLEYVRRVTEFSGLTLIGWCVMTNHFHLLVYLPVPEVPDEAEVVRRYGALKGTAAMNLLVARLKTLHGKGEEGEREVSETLDKIRRRMYRVDEYMRIVKQWFSEEYNSRNGHTGTMWESVYHDTAVPYEREDMRHVLGYINLNPIRAAITDRFDGYAWSSFTAFCRGDRLSEKGMRFLYGDEMTRDEITESHALLLEKLLEEEKLKRAREIVRLRAAGVSAPCDHLTNEVLVAQVAAQMKVIHKDAVELHEAREHAANKLVARNIAEKQILALLTSEGPLTAPQIAKAIDLGERTVQRYMNALKADGKVVHANRFAPWQVVEKPEK